ncbi:serine/threonine-protein kinase [Microbulbifer sp. Q7]|uniref:serine/threonine-protein kinase n=1 Tax=Microbulbifer sp. Q7 TaxID=1785091 RepID=UPI00082B19A7|nr:serine/threonine-protein kinase [Microbulbifer sp. Q7]
MEFNTWGKIERLFNEALEHPPNARDQFLERACAGDEALRQSVESLLQQCTGGEQAAHIVENAARHFLDGPVLQAGVTLGAYRIIRPIGHGGMGDVYLAERADQTFDKRVAIKLIRNQLLNSDDVNARFHSERQILAALEHPGIARLLDGGSTPEGIPYLVMEYIEGESITSYCHRHNASLEQRLVLFRKVCEAVDYAHQHLVVHRDIKPSNILVSTDGQPRLVDFGIAKILENSSIPLQQPETDIAERLLTPHYSSPEQLRGEAVSTASDVYALGVVLFELLTNCRPFEQSTTAAHTVVQAILQQDPVSPSRALAQLPTHCNDDNRANGKLADIQNRPGWRRQLRGDLDNITLMALRREPGRRYASASRFAEDIRNYLEKRPVNARPSSWGYVISRFIARNRAASASLTLLVAAIFSFGALLWLQAEELRAQRDLARQQLVRAGTISDFLSQMFSGLNPDKAQGREVTVREMLDQAAQQLKSRETTGADQRTVTATLHRVIGTSYAQLGLPSEADEHMQFALRAYRDGVITSPREQLRTLLAVSDVLHLQFNSEERLKIAREAMEIARRLNPPDPVLKLDALSLYASALHMAGQLPAAHEQFNKLYIETQVFYGAKHPKTLLALSNLGVINHWLGNFDISEARYRECYRIANSALGEKHTISLKCLSNLGSVLEVSGQFDAAVPVLERHIRLAREVVGPDHPETLRTMHNLADVYRGLVRYDESENLFLETLQKRKAALGPVHIETLQTQYKLGRLYAEQQRYQEALALLESSHTKLVNQLGPDHPTTLIAKGILDSALHAAGAQPAG